MHWVMRYVDSLGPDDVVVTGCARGVDEMARISADQLGKAFVVHRADWDAHGKAAGPLRNKQIVEDCDRVVAFWDGVSRGTRSTIRLANDAGKPVELFLDRKPGER